ncbi:biotin transporter BioY [Clostridium tetani]|uniref:Biotin transporter n=1 Tax=Clostridium tetani TaxID=1513 RepID=A0A4Q0VD83_CLOTA|nr:biotin transporter BioY [Clostridium tetani]RXI49922.1 biotin transporter BioY [Clostridium tetani]BDR67631.1 biotin transporter BioY [Clostridium tetani]BDR73021.1 biotin transporter BioY [Clostridium tetani]BDR81564.1 biotin transporter BioY [Clostridium tetani]
MRIIVISSKTNSLIMCALFASLVAIGAFIQVPVPFMDYFTLQFLFVVLSGLILGPSKGAVSVGIYVLMGLCGLPIFAAGGGLTYIVKPSFGFLLGFILAAWVAGLVSNKLKEYNYKNMLMASFAALITVYTVGIIYKYFILNYYISTKVAWSVLLISCFPVDIPGDILLCILGAYLAKRLNTIVRFSK